MLPQQSRYSCQVSLPGFGEEKQLLLQQARVLIIGAGGLGCPAAQYLAAMGVGAIGIADDDTVSVSNLHRQILYTAADAGMKKAEVACAKLQQQNPDVALICHPIRINDEQVLDIIRGYDLVLDCTDNFDARYLINDACVFLGKPVIYGAIYQYEGQVSVWNAQLPDGTHSPNYRDVYPSVNAAMVPNCTDGGVLPTLAGIIGCMMANEAAKLITRTGDTLAGSILLFDARYMQSRTIRINKTTEVQVKRPPKAAPVVATLSHNKLRENMGNYLLIDVRSEDEHNAFNIGGVNIPMSNLDMAADYLLDGTPVVFYCYSGMRSAEAVKALKHLFATEMYSLEGGIKNW